MASLKYFLLRTVLFVVPFAVFMVLGIGAILSAVYAVLIAFAINFLFLSRQRNAAAGEVRDVFSGRKEVRTKQELKDAEVEDALDDAGRAEDEAPTMDALPGAGSEPRQDGHAAEGGPAPVDGRVGDGRVGDGRVRDGRAGDGRLGDGGAGDGAGAAPRA